MKLNNMDLTKAQQLAKNDKFVLLTMLVLFSLMPQMAVAAPWDDMADTIIDLLTNGLTRSVAIIACIGLGLAAWVGKLSWGMVGKFVAGIVLIFGAAAIVDVFIGGVV